MAAQIRRMPRSCGQVVRSTGQLLWTDSDFVDKRLVVNVAES